MTSISKIFSFIILSIFFNVVQCKYSYAEISPSLEKRLNEEARKATCCAKKMRCCKKHPPPPNVEIRAVIARCIDPPNVCTKNRNLKKTLNRGNINNLQKFQGFDEDEPLVQSEVTKCAKKLILTVKIKNEGETNTHNQFIVVDHVYDPLSDQTVRILNPYVIKMRQEHLSQTYLLKFLDFVNSQAREQVYNKHDGNYTGCCMTDKNPTCGLVTYKGKPISFSGGFCCSCDAQKNAQRQPPQTKPDPVIALSDPAYLLDAVQCPRTNIHDKMAIEKEEEKKKQNEKQEEKENKKRNMNSDNIYYINPQTKYRKKDDFVSELKGYNNDISGHFRPASNYKIQTMNDEYEDQLSNTLNIPDQFGKNRPLELHSSKNYLFKTKQNNEYNKMAKAVKGTLNKKKKTHIKKIASISKKMKNVQTNKAKSNKPSMHKLLHSDNIYSTVGIYNFKNSIRQIADKAFKDAIKSQNLAAEQKKGLDAESGPSPEESEFDLPENIYEKRQVQSSGVQRRGGQNCADRFTPPHLDPETYHESTHCLRFSPVWYGVYKLDKPIVEQETIFQVYEKYETESGGMKWKDLTRGKKVKLGTFSPFYKDETPTISMTFSSLFDDQDFCLSWDKLRLLIPEGLKVSELGKYPEAKGGPAEFLLVPAEKIVMSGDQCDVAGVGFEAFYKQPNRCSMPRGSCLHHQPFHMWSHDRKMERDGKKGCFFLKYHGKLSKNPIRKNATSQDKFLTLNYYGRYVSMIDMEINADFNAVLRPTSAAVITEVYIDSTCATRTYITIKVSNAGLLSSKFMVRICDCPLDLNGKWNDIQSDLILIPPQNQHIFKLAAHVQLTVDIFHCSVEVLNSERELVALRRIRIQKMDRCICTWHCLCACIGSSTGLKCIPMKIDHYHAAGFKGGLPIITYVEHVAITDDIFRLILFIFSFIFFTLFILGLTKAIIGLCCLPIGSWGLNILLDLPKPMNKYYEKNLKDRPVEYDSSGWPIHPDTKERVRNIPTTAEFCTNILFFFTYPTIIFIILLKRFCCPFYSYEKIKKPKKKKKPNWFRKYMCNTKSCIHQQTQADGAFDAPYNDSDKKKKKEKEKSPSREKTPALGKSPSKEKHASKNKSPSREKSPSKDKLSSREKSPSKDKLSSRAKSPSREKGRDKTPEHKKQVKESKDKKKPTIKVSIKEHPRQTSKSVSPRRKSSIEITDNPYYYSSTDDATLYSTSTESTKKSAQKIKSAASSNTSSR